MKINSITLKLCILLVGFMATMLLIIGGWSIINTNKIVQQELGRMNSYILDEIADNMSILLDNVDAIGNNIVEDNKLVKTLGMSKSEIEEDVNKKKEIYKYVEGLLNEQVWKYGEYTIKPELYVISENGLNFSTYSKIKYDIEGVRKEPWYEEIVKADGQTVLISTAEDEEGIGPYKSIFRMGRLIKDLITEETLGVLIIDISEKILYDRYSKILEDGKLAYVVDEEGKVISSKDKRLIGKNYFNDIYNGENLESTNWYTVFKRNENTYMKVESVLDKYNWKIVTEVPLHIIREPIKEITKQFLVTLVLVIILLISITYKLSEWITRPVLNIKDTIQKVMKGDLKAQIKVDRVDEIGELEDAFNNMVKWLDKSMKGLKEEEKKKRIAELSFLQAQINPHFLYNTLSGIRFLVSMNKSDEAEEMVYRLIKLLRSVLPKANELIEIEEEINIVKDYIELQKIRYPGEFEVNIDISEEIKKFKVPVLILQPVIENAIFYSIGNEACKGIINIKGYINEDNINIEINDNGRGMNNSKIKSVLEKKDSINRVGLINVHERIQLNYGKDYGLKILSNEGEGTRVIFILPSW